MDRHIGITTDETLCPALLFGVSGTKHLSEQRLQGRNHSFALRQVPNDYKGYGLSKELARRTIVERIATETKHIILHYSACPLRTTARGRRLCFLNIFAWVFTTVTVWRVNRGNSACTCFDKAGKRETFHMYLYAFQ